MREAISSRAFPFTKRGGKGERISFLRFSGGARGYAQQSHRVYLSHVYIQVLDDEDDIFCWWRASDGFYFVQAGGTKDRNGCCLACLSCALPASMTSLFLITTMLSTIRAVLKRCVINKQVLSCMNVRKCSSVRAMPLPVILLTTVRCEP